MGFKEMVAQDVRKVFLNTDELAERRTIHYDEEEYLDLPVMLQDQELERREIICRACTRRRRSSTVQGRV